MVKYCVHIDNAAECTYFKWDKIALILHTVLASGAVFYVFHKKLYRCDNVCWMMGKQIRHLTVDFDMDAKEDIKMLKEDYESRKHFLIETNLGYTPAYDISSLSVSKKGSCWCRSFNILGLSLGKILDLK